MEVDLGFSSSLIMEPEPSGISNSPVKVVDNLQVEDCEIDAIPTPKKKAIHVGMLFETIEDAKTYYEDYGRQEGFCIRTRTSSKSRSRCNEVTYAKFVSIHEGKHNKSTKNHEIEATEREDVKRRRCSTVMGGCNASLRVIHDKVTSKFMVTSFNDDHNHKLVTPSRRMKMKSNRCMPKAIKDLTESFHRENLEIGKVPAILDGSHIGFDSRDCYNHLRNVRYKEGIGGDAQSVLTYFRRKKEENPQFFYAVQCDENGRAANLFGHDKRICPSNPNRKNIATTNPRNEETHELGRYTDSD